VLYRFRSPLGRRVPVAGRTTTSRSPDGWTGNTGVIDSIFRDLSGTTHARTGSEVARVIPYANHGQDGRVALTAKTAASDHRRCGNGLRPRRRTNSRHSPTPLIAAGRSRGDRPWRQALRAVAYRHAHDPL